MSSGAGPPGDRPPAPPEGELSAAAAATTSGSTLRGGAWTSLAFALPQVYTLVLSVVAARFLGPIDMGRQSFIAWAALSLTAMVTSGLAGALQRYVAELLGRDRPELAAALVRRVWYAALVLALAGGSVLAAIGMLRDELESAWLLAGIASAAAVLHSVPHAMLLGWQRFRDATLAGVVTGAVGVVGAIVVLALGGGIPGLFAVEAAMAIVTAVWLTRISRRTLASVPRGARLGRKLGREILGYVAYATLAGLLLLIVERRSEFVALELYSSADEIAFYSIAFGAVTALFRLVQGATAPVVPAVATLYGAGAGDRIRSGIARAVRLMLLISLPATAAGFALGPSVIVLFYGTDYKAAGPVLLVLVGVFPFLALGSLYGAVMDGLGLVKQLLVVMAVAAVLDVGIAFVLVPELDAVGAAIANGTAQLATALLLAGTVLRAVGSFDARLLSLLPAAIVSAAAFAAGLAVTATVPDGAGFLIGAPVFVLVLTGLGLLLRAVPRDDAAWFAEAMGDRFGGRPARVLARYAGAP